MIVFPHIVYQDKGEVMQDIKEYLPRSWGTVLEHLTVHNRLAIWASVSSFLKQDRLEDTCENSWHSQMSYKM